MNFTTFRDMLLIMLIGFVFMIVAMIPFLNPPAREDEVEPPGNVIVHIVWPPGDTDVDLWTMGPGEIAPVGYSNKSGILWSLLRDDTGDGVDVTELNFENAYTRGIVPGEYIVNVHCYRCTKFPVPVKVVISVKRESASGGNASLATIASTKVVLHAPKEAKTALRFELTADGKIVPNSMNHVYRQLRSPDADNVEDMDGRRRGRGWTP